MTKPFKPEYLESRQLVDKIESGVTVVTGNLRLSHALQGLLQQKQLNDGLSVWETADILPWDAWIRRIFKTGQKTLDESENRLLLSEGQERILWERVISETDAGRVLAQISSTARHCAAGWRLFHEWRLSTKDLQCYENEDSKIFLQWCELFLHHCKEGGWISSAQLPTVIAESHQTIKTNIANTLILTGFDEMTPQQIKLFTILEQQSIQVQWIEKKPSDSDVVTVKLSQARDEIESAARWARQIVDNHANARVGIVVTELSAYRTVVQGIFDRVLIPSSIDPDKNDIQRPYNISLGLPLIRTALIETALLFLKWRGGQCSVETLSIALSSPYMGGWQTERFARALLERKLRDFGRHDISLSILTTCASDSEKPYYCPLFISILTGVGEIVEQWPLEATGKDWTNNFSNLLTAFEWGQGRALNSEEYQTKEAWTDLIRALGQLDQIGELMDCSQAYRYLLESAHERIFQPQTADAPIQILGMMEVIGLEFDYLWVMGLHDGLWPAQAKPNPFLPVVLQREKMLPHSSSRREARVAARITHRLMGNAPVVIFSYPDSQGDEQLRPSALLHKLAQMTLDQMSLWEGQCWDRKIYQAAANEIWMDDPVPVLDKKSIKGGSQIFKLQAICPFRAFSELRLGARPVEAATAGLAASERGTLVHLVMEYIWLSLRDQQRLLSLSESALKKEISICVKRALGSLEHMRGETINARLQELEQLRLEKLIHEWLMIEKQRQTFTVIQAEQKVRLEIEGMNINLKVDRVDMLEDGSRVVIDYKTGQVNPSQWFGERPEEPQLPLYSMSFPDQLIGLVFAQLKPGESVFKGVTREKDSLPGVKSFAQIPQAKSSTDWNELLLTWKGIIEKLARDYSQGIAVVDPLKYPGSCQYCSLGQLCRVNEKNNKNREIER